MNKINTLRASILLTGYVGSEASRVVSNTINLFFQNEPSYTEIVKCTKCCIITKKNSFPLLVSAASILQNDWNNLAASITNNFPTTYSCSQCQDSNVIIDRVYNKHLLIEVSPPNDSGPSMFEKQKAVKLESLPLRLKMQQKTYILHGAIAFDPPQLLNEIGHYKACVRVNDKWAVYDDLKKDSSSVRNSTEIIIHCLIFIQQEK